MHRHLLLLLSVAAVPVALTGTEAQQAARPVPFANRDTAAKTDGVNKDDDDNAVPTITTGVSIGGLNYEGGRTERATSAVLRWHPVSWLSIGATPTFARAAEPSGVALRPATTRSGLTDLPVEVGAYHIFDAPLSPSLSLGVGVTLPVGDTTTGFGTGAVGTSISVGGGLALSERLGVHLGAGRSLSDFSVHSTFNGTSPEFGDAGLSLQATDQLSMSVGVDGDIGQLDPTYGRAASLTGGVSVALPYINSVSLNVSRGISGASPSWALSFGVGTDFAAIGSVSMTSAASRLRRTFGGGTHGLAPKGSKTPATTTTTTTRRKRR